MKHPIIQSTLMVVALMVSATAQSAWTGNVGAYLGEKRLDDQDWFEHDEHGSIGMVADFKQTDWPVSIAVDVFGTGDEDELGARKHEVYTAELHVGVRKLFKLPIEDCKLRPYVGGGLALVHAEEKDRNDGTTATETDSGQGYWIGAGTYFRITEQLNLGFDIRYSEADLRLGGEERDAGGMLVGFGVGYHW